jgi:membrane protease YdiL (CAAX protease family)
MRTHASMLSSQQQRDEVSLMTVTTASLPHAPDHRPTAAGSELTSLLAFAAVAVPSGWLFLSVPLLADLPVAPFVLLTNVLGLLLPALVLTRRTGGSVRALLRDTVRLPRPLGWLLPGALLLPALTWSLAALAGVQERVDGALVASLTVNVVSSVLIINLWEELAWAGFAQRRATALWGYARGALVIAALFAAIHLPLAFYDADTAGAVALNVVALLGSAVGLRLLIGAFDSWTAGSLLTVALLHASFNVSGELLDVDHDWLRYAAVLAVGLAAWVRVSVRRPLVDRS